MSVLLSEEMAMSKQQVLRQGPVKITRAAVDGAWRKRAPAQRTIISDAECRGLALVVNATSMAWRLEYKPRGVDPLTGKRFASSSIVLGNPASLSPDAARDAANKMKGEAKTGVDPAAQKKARLAEDARKRAGTLKRLLDLYQLALPSRPKLRGGHGTLSDRAVAEELTHTSAAILAMSALDKSAETISGADIRRMLEGLADKPATARHRFGALSRFYDWAQDEGHVAVNPCGQLAKARRPRPPKPRPTFHTLKQLGQLWQAIETADGLHQVHRDLLHFLIAVPCRRGEATGMQWGNVDLAGSIWTQPGKETKNGDMHQFHLPPLALDILKHRHEAAGKPAAGYAFPAPRSGKAIDTFGKAKKAVDAALKTKLDWRLHDHRRSFVTALAEAGVHEAVLDGILNHRQAATRAGVLGVYQRAQRWPEQVEAIKKWGELLSKEIGEENG
jgi:integrase